MLAFPVGYRAGARVPHAHAGVQIWWEAARGEFHSHDERGGLPSAADHMAVEPGGVTVGGSPNSVSGAARGHGAAPDAPKLSDVTPVVDRIAVVGAGLLLLILVAGARRRQDWPTTVAPLGRRPGPETPPPRFGLA